jgi:DNA-binding XRE family transcriptional regulator
MVQEERTNNLVQYRKRLKLTQPEVARLLGWKNIKGLCELESGRALPTLITAFKLSIIYRVPTEFLYRELYERLRDQIRTKELAVSPVGQQTLPLRYADFLRS